jgi:hypothetical protein
MTVTSRPERPAQPGDWVRWYHPRLALARGWFTLFGPGPFEVVGVLPAPDRERPLAYLLRTASGERLVEAAWVGLPQSAAWPAQ